MYLGVLAVLAIGTVLARLRARGMAWALTATALAVVVVAVIALATGLQDTEGASVIEILGLTAMYAGLFGLSAWLFGGRPRSRPPSQPVRRRPDSGTSVHATDPRAPQPLCGASDPYRRRAGARPLHVHERRSVMRGSGLIWTIVGVLYHRPAHLHLLRPARRQAPGHRSRPLSSTAGRRSRSSRRSRRDGPRARRGLRRLPGSGPGRGCDGPRKEHRHGCRPRRPLHEGEPLDHRQGGRRVGKARHRHGVRRLDVRTLMNHMLETGSYFVGAARGEDVAHRPASRRHCGDDPVADFERVRDDTLSTSARTASSRRAVRHWGSPSATSCCAAGTSPRPRARTPPCRKSCGDGVPLIHGKFTDEQRVGVFKPEIPVGENASAQDRLLAYTGRPPSS